MKISFYEPFICYDHQQRKPMIDNNMTRFSASLAMLQDKYPQVTIERYVLTEHPEKFKENKLVWALVEDYGSDILPITLVNNQIAKTHRYPKVDELEGIVVDHQ